ncbi:MULTISPECIES: two-component system response regulator [Streptacidiphilus]|uniref:Two-component system response regulator n=2 Tax=Streptacidiphilus TaxID=228398 RepID=A0ABV6UF65_9ACTN|nr:response regulator [Streptacidiphilus jeojiense]
MTMPTRILLVDDMEANLIALESVLRPLGQQLIRACTGEQALKALLRDEYAVVLLDVMMPGMDGFETAAHIKRLDQTKDVPIVFLTGVETGSAMALRGYSAGAVDYLTKPFDPWVLRAKVSVFVELHRKGRRLDALAAGLDAAERRLRALEQDGAASGDSPSRIADLLAELSRSIPVGRG